MSVSVALGLVLALLTAFGSVAGFLYKFRGARSVEQVELRRPIRSTILLFHSPVYSLGIAIGLSSWLLHVGALALAPISLAQATVAGGLVLLTVAANQLFGIEVTRREWIGVTLMAAGLAALAATLDGDARSAHSHYAAGTLTVYLLATAGGGAGRGGRARPPNTTTHPPGPPPPGGGGGGGAAAVGVVFFPRLNGGTV